MSGLLHSFVKADDATYLSRDLIRDSRQPFAPWCPLQEASE